MAFEALRGYVQAATGLTEMTTNRARAVVRELLSSGETGLSQMSGQVDKMAKELVAMGKTNREQLDELVRLDVNRLLGALDLARDEDVDRLRARVGELEARVASAEEVLRKISAERSRTTAEGGASDRAAGRSRTTAEAGSPDRPAGRSRTTAEGNASGRPAERAAKAGKAGKAGTGKGRGEGTGKGAKATGAAASDTVKASTGKAARAPRARTTTKSAKSTSGGGA
ncbi:hypothetical protein CA984_21595 [Streptosporangium minutum]|uniref:Polyhydroxyalkanoate synthesis protein PhaF n=2 Tax=Streptosporangium minutum TaxID=569862 RepID=A0A243RIE6_9ACTN|nr:hypothetical protein CA984_21595 [Streptosporangium minutum]